MSSIAIQNLEIRLEHDSRGAGVGTTTSLFAFSALLLFSTGGIGGCASLPSFVLACVTRGGFFPPWVIVGSVENFNCFGDAGVVCETSTLTSSFVFCFSSAICMSLCIIELSLVVCMAVLHWAAYVTA